MKHIYIGSIISGSYCEADVKLFAWVISKRHHGGILFFTLADSTGQIQCFIKKDHPAFDTAEVIKPESLVQVQIEISAESDSPMQIQAIDVLTVPSCDISPRPRQQFDIFASKHVDQVLRHKHLYIRNEAFINIMKIKHQMLKAMRTWFDDHCFTEIDTPILTPLSLYAENETFQIDYFESELNLSQCAGLYLQAVVQSLEKVYTVTPAFRSAPSKSPRHNPEFWHIKGQVAFCDLEDMMSLITDMIAYVVKAVLTVCERQVSQLGTQSSERLDPNWCCEQITYTEALQRLKKRGLTIEFGRSLSAKAESLLAKDFGKPFFVMYLPSATEPFPYKRCQKDERLTMTADLIAPNGFGEILGVAEFDVSSHKLEQRLRLSGQWKAEYSWYLQMMGYAPAPHAGFGAGVERILRWLIGLNHVRDTFPFPRLYHRCIDQ